MSFQNIDIHSLNLLNFVRSVLYDVGAAFQLPRIPITDSGAIRI